MFPQHFDSFEFLQKKKDIFIYRAKDQTHRYILKSIITKDDAVRQAFYDEYESLSALNLESIPVYYGICDNFHYPDMDGSFLTLCMEDCSDKKPLNLYSIPLSQLLKVLYQTGNILLRLLENGILYTDLNPSNILKDSGEGMPEITLIDFTYCYYYKRNPYPNYPLKFSYQLTPSLKGQQLLIQELALLLQEKILLADDSSLPSSVYFLLETGLHPSPALLLKDYLILIQKSFV